MIIYVDLLFIINFIFDYIILLTTSLILKRNTSKKRILLGSLIGELSLVILFIHLNIILLSLFKIFLSILICTVTFSYKDISYTINNIVYFYLNSIILGGFMYFLVEEFKINITLSIRYIVILVSSPIVLYIYYVLTDKIKTNYNNRYKVYIEYNGLTVDGVGYLDSGNKLISPYSDKLVILIEKKYINLNKLKIIYVPYNALNYHGLIKCFNPDKVIVDGKEINNILIGISDRCFNIEGCNILLNGRMNL